MKTGSSISIKTQEELQLLREAGKILASIVKELKSSLKANVITKDIDAHAEQLIKKHEVIPAFKGYRGFPCNICISINNEVVHGIPSERRIKEGDVVSIDVGIIHKGYYSDTAFTRGIGSMDPTLQKLILVTQEALYKGILEAKVGNYLSDISHAIQSIVESNSFSIVRDFVGHGIGKNLHEDPEIPNFGDPHQGPVLKQGMVFAIEPMVNAGSWQTSISSDGWTVTTKDGKPSAHFEHTVAVTKDGPEVLTDYYG